jgi:hypothetical protein
MELNASDKHSRQVPKHTVAFWLGETSEHSHLPQNQPGLGGVCGNPKTAALVGWLVPLCSLLWVSQFSLCFPQPRTRWIGLPRWLARHLAVALVSVCPTGRGLTPPTGCPTSYTRIWCGDGSLEKTLCEHITLHSLGWFFALPIQIQLAHTHRACSASMRNRCPLPCLKGGLSTQSRTESRWLVAPLPCGFALQWTHLEWWSLHSFEGRGPPTQHCLAWEVGHAR